MWFELNTKWLDENKLKLINNYQENVGENTENKMLITEDVVPEPDITIEDIDDTYGRIHLSVVINNPPWGDACFGIDLTEEQAFKLVEILKRRGQRIKKLIDLGD